MESRTDKNSYTIIFAIAMVLVVGSVLAYAASSLSGRISENQRIEKQQNILYAFGINENSETGANFVSADKVADEFSKYVTKQLVIENGNVTEDEKAYLIDVKKEKSNAKDDASKDVCHYLLVKLMEKRFM